MLRTRFIIIVVTALLFIAGIGIALKERQIPQNTPAVELPVETPVKDWVDAQRSLFQPLIPETAPMPITPAKPGNQNKSSASNSDVPDVARSDLSTVLSKTIPGRQLLQGSQKKQRNTQFTKIGFDGQVLPDTALRWSCARDKRTNLLWETKLFNAGISDVEHRYSWYDPAHLTQGVKNQGKCYGIACDSYSYKQEMNRLELCGSTQWRLPFFAELETLLDRNYFNPVINQEIFFNTRGASYWTQSRLENNPEMVMQIDFFNGTSSPAPIHFKLAVRLVSD